MERSPGGSLAQTLTYNTLIKGLGRELRVGEAFEVARGMADRGCLPNEVLSGAATAAEAAVVGVWDGCSMAFVALGLATSRV